MAQTMATRKIIKISMGFFSRIIFIGYSGGIYRCRAFSYLMPAMDSIIEATANRLRIRGDSFHTRFLGL